MPEMSEPLEAFIEKRRKSANGSKHPSKNDENERIARSIQQKGLRSRMRLKGVKGGYGSPPPDPPPSMPEARNERTARSVHRKTSKISEWLEASIEKLRK